MSRISIAEIRSMNELLASSHDSLTAVFVGATSGIGFGILEAFTKHIPNPKAVVIGRSKEAFAPKIEELKQINSSLDLTFIETDVSLLKNVDAVCKQIKATVDQINLLFLSPGYINFGARDDTEEGFDRCQALRYHTRLRFTVNLLPSMSAPYSRVVSILAGGQEAPIDLDDLELRKPGAYGVLKAGGTAAAMTTLMAQKLAKENPQVGFIHASPGLVRTGLLSRGSSGVLGMLLKWVVQPLTGFMGMTIAEAGERFLCYATSDRFAGPSVDAKDAAKLAKPIVPGCWILNADGKAVGNEKVLSDLKSQGGEDRVWEHTIAEWKRVLG